MRVFFYSFQFWVFHSFFDFSALTALRNKEISANKAAKVYKIPSSTLYKIARKEGIELAQPFNAVATTWSQVYILSQTEK